MMKYFPRESESFTLRICIINFVSIIKSAQFINAYFRKGDGWVKYVAKYIFFSGRGDEKGQI